MKNATLLVKIKKLAILALTSVTLVSALSVGAFAAEYGEKKYQYGGELYGNYEEDANFAKLKYLSSGDILNFYKSETKADCIKYIDEKWTQEYIDGFFSNTGGSYAVQKLSELFKGQIDDTNGKWRIVDRCGKLDDIGYEYYALIVQYDTTIPTDDINDFNDFVPVSIALPTVQLSHHSVTGYVGGTLDLDYTYFNMTEPTAAWTSSDETVATVDADGIVTFVKKGEVTITLTVEGYGELKCNINVKGKGITKR